jgi:hypothetical protein
VIYLVGVMCLLAGLVAGLVYALKGHERREFRRQDEQTKREGERARREDEREHEARERHGQVVGELRDMRALTLGAITQRTNIEADLRRALEVLTDHAEIFDAVQSERRAKRP